MYIHLMAEKQFGPDKREQSVIFPIDGLMLEDWFDGSGIVAPNCCKITCQGLAYKVKLCRGDLIKALGIIVKELKKAA